ncbi:helix-turn-helix domain-containing protein [Legionella saoudiensis]|uniref:helix-turn-helix domain-containing protein n=1 Tax=Legionella saoudiensis TaxID=1750561 RepID=UPI0007305375|nr:XRE family transcriptional regulator [Legionella saoudiensis]
MSSSLTDINSVLACLLDKACISEAELAREIQIPRATINRLVSGRTPDPRASTLNAIAAYFRVSVDQLIGKQPLFDNSQDVILNTNSLIPIIELDEAFEWSKVLSNITPTNHSDFVVIDHSTCQGKFGIRVKGESMWPQFQINTILIISTEKMAKNRDFVIAYIKESNEVVFRQLMIDGNYKFLKAINTLFPAITFQPDDKLIGTVIQTRLNLD